MEPPDGGQYSHACHMVKSSPPPSGQSRHTVSVSAKVCLNGEGDRSAGISTE